MCSLKKHILALAGVALDRALAWELLVQFPVRAHVWVAGQVPNWCVRGNHTLMFLSPSFSLPSPLKIVLKIFKKHILKPPLLPFILNNTKGDHKIFI